MTKKIAIFLVDDHTLVRTGLKLLLKSHPDLQVTGEAGHGQEVLDQLSSVAADVLLLDISMPKMSGLDCLVELKKRFPHLKILILSMHDDKSYVQRAMSLGASGYVHKSSADIELFDAIDEIRQGNIYISRKIAQKLLDPLFLSREKERSATDTLALSQREREVLQYIVLGHSMTEIGKLLHLSVKTVDTYKTRIMDKLNCTKKSELVQFALKSGLLNALDVPSGG